MFVSCVVIPYTLAKINQLFYDTFASEDVEARKQRKKEKRKLLRKARIAKELGNRPKDLKDYRLFFVGLEDFTSSEEER